MAVIPATVLPTIRIGGTTFTDLTNLKILRARINGSSLYIATARDVNNFSTSGYVVPVGKTFRILAWRITAIQSASAGTTYLNFGYGDTDVGWNSGSAPTNPKYHGGDALSGPLTGTLSTTAMEGLEFSIKLDIPAGKYPLITNGSAGTLACIVDFYGYEV